MSSSITPKELSAIRKRRFISFKRVWGVSYSARALGCLLPILVADAASPSILATPVPAFTLGVAIVFLDVWVSYLQRRAEHALNTEEHWAHFDQVPTTSILLDLASEVQAPAIPDGDYWDKTEAKSPAHAKARNILESVWWTERLATIHFSIFAACTCLFLCVIIASLLWSSRTEAADVATLMLAVFLGLSFPSLAVRYWWLRQDCRWIQAEIFPMLKSQDLRGEDVYGAIVRYQIARAGSPPLLETVYRVRRETLKKTWDAVQPK